MRYPDRGLAIVRRGRTGLLFGLAALTLAGCGTTTFSPETSMSTKAANFLAFDSTKAPALPNADGGPKASTSCPEVIVLEGTAAQRIFAGAENSENLRYQFSIGDVARECFVVGDKLTIKVGIHGRILLGPAGSPGHYTLPVRIAVIGEKSQAPVLSKIYRIDATVPAGQSAADYDYMVEPMVVPNLSDRSDDDYNIKLGVDSKGADVADKPARRRKRS
jgi:hypothetical protein